MHVQIQLYVSGRQPRILRRADIVLHTASPIQRQIRVPIRGRSRFFDYKPDLLEIASSCISGALRPVVILRDCSMDVVFIEAFGKVTIGYLSDLRSWKSERLVVMFLCSGKLLC